ncbi:MAG: DUF58 domain-containing protein [Actinomycetota bacterium]
MVPRPARRAFSMFFGSLVLFGVGANAQAGWLYVIGSGMLGVVVAGFVLPTMAVRGLRFSRNVSPMCRVGDPISVSLVCRNESRSVRGPLTGSDDFLAESTFVLPNIRGGAEVILQHKVVPVRRGVFQLGTVKVASGAPFGIAKVRRRFEVASPSVVHPRWVSLSSFPLLEAASAPMESLHERPRRGAGMEFFGLREHRSGDSLRNVHWRSSARGARLLVKEFEEHLASRLTIFIDNSEVVGAEPLTSFEDSAAVAASLAIYALGAGHPVQMFCGHDMVFEPNKHQALDWLSSIEASRPRSLSHLVSDAETFRRSTAVVILPSTKAKWAEAISAIGILQERSARVIAVVLSADTYQPRSGYRESELFETLDAAGVVVYRVARNEDLRECLQAPCLV